ncbi:MAG: hypothetical protein ACI4OE_02260 [Alphaproteobacteria bacterium]|nr:hypothetical protein [Alphaproteobacteria bacterium]
MSKIFENKKVQLAILFFKWLARICYWVIKGITLFLITVFMIFYVMIDSFGYPVSYMQFLTKEELAVIYKYDEIWGCTLIMLILYLLGVLCGLFSKFFRTVETAGILCCSWMIFNVIYQLQVDDIAASNQQSVEVSSEAVEE